MIIDMYVQGLDTDVSAYFSCCGSVFNIDWFLSTGIPGEMIPSTCKCFVFIARGWIS